MLQTEVAKIVDDSFSRAKDLFLSRLHISLQTLVREPESTSESSGEVKDRLLQYLQTELESAIFIDLSSHLDRILDRLHHKSGQPLQRLSVMSFGNLLESHHSFESVDSHADRSIFETEPDNTTRLDTPGFQDAKPDDCSEESFDEPRLETEYDYSPGKRLTTRGNWEDEDSPVADPRTNKRNENNLETRALVPAKRWHNLRPEVKIKVIERREEEPKNLYHQMVYFLYKLTPTQHEGPVLLHEGNNIESLEWSMAFRFLSENLISIAKVEFESQRQQKRINPENPGTERAVAAKLDFASWWNFSVEQNEASRTKNYRYITELLANLLEANVQNHSTTELASSKDEILGRYETDTKNHVEQTGIWTHSDFPWLATAVDGLVVDDAVKERGILKIYGNSKKQTSAWFGLLEPGATEHAKHAFNQQHPAIYEIQVSLLLLESDWCDVVVYDLDSETLDVLHIERIMKNPDLQNELVRFVSKLYISLLLPSFASKSLSNQEPNFLVLSDTAFEEEYRFIMQR